MGDIVERLRERIANKTPEAIRARNKADLDKYWATPRDDDEIEFPPVPESETGSMIAMLLPEAAALLAEIERLRPLLGLVQGIRNYVDGRGGVLARDIAEMIDMAEGMKA